LASDAYFGAYRRRRHIAPSKLSRYLGTNCLDFDAETTREARTPY
jgi:hypothetical protein